MTGKDKAAILLIALGQEISKEVFKHLEGEEIEELYLQIAKTTKGKHNNVVNTVLFNIFHPTHIKKF